MITLTREEAQQVLDAMEAMQTYTRAERKGLRIFDEAIETLRARLAQPEQRTGDCLLTGVCAAEGHRIQKAQPEPEPVAWMDVVGSLYHFKEYDTDKPLYTAPPQREWQGLTEDDWNEFMTDHLPSEHYGHTRMRAVWEFSQAKLKAKNAP